MSWHIRRRLITIQSATCGRQPIPKESATGLSGSTQPPRLKLQPGWLLRPEFVAAERGHHGQAA